jgi:hypothetical protein
VDLAAESEHEFGSRKEEITTTQTEKKKFEISFPEEHGFSLKDWILLLKLSKI